MGSNVTLKPSFLYANASSLLNYYNSTTAVQGQDRGDDEDGNTFENCTTGYACEAGLILPVWHPSAQELGEPVKVYRAVLYLLALAYILFGVNIITDRMISCIEVIISQKRTITVTLKNGETHKVNVPIWHPIVATLTVHVIGASAAEIFLPVIEMAKHRFVAHELGSSLIFGSGAYHLFIITGLCIVSVKGTAGKPIKDLRVFFVTTFFAIFAYLWMYLLVGVASPGQITLTEAIVTVALFPILVFTAWFVDRRLYRTIRKKIMRCTGAVGPSPANGAEQAEEATSDIMREVERRRRIAGYLKELRAKHPDKSEIELEGMAQVELLESLPKDAAFYRLQASKAMSGGGDVISKEKITKRLEHEHKLKDERDRENAINPNAQLVGFEQAQSVCIESCGSALAAVRRFGPGVDYTVLLVDYETIQDTAIAGNDYEHAGGTLEFQPGVLTLNIAVNIIDDDEFEENKTFKIQIANPRLEMKKIGSKEIGHLVDEVVITQAETSTCILDDDHCGVFHFETPIGTGKIKVNRSTGARGRVKVPFKVLEGSAKEGHDYTLPAEQELTFENNQSEAVVEIPIIDRNRVGDVISFFIELGQPQVLSQPPQNPLGNPVLGQETKIEIRICEDDKLAEIIDRLLLMGDIADLISSTTWAEQIKEAITLPSPISSNHHDDEGDSALHGVKSLVSGTNSMACKSCQNYFGNAKLYLLYGLAFPWKLLSAAVPPPRYLHGWLAFVLLLIVMAFLSALIGDFASAFACTIGLKDTVTAITLVSFGMGLPDTFASRHAAMHEKEADAAIGGITGSNAVNVFLGIGISWVAASAYHSSRGTVFQLPNSNLGFIVVVYCVLAAVAILMLMLRRLPPIRGELGGPVTIKYASAAFFLALWLTFVLLLAFQSYCVIGSF